MDASINANLIVFESSPDFSDNSRGLWEYVNSETGYETYWAVHDPTMVERLHSQGIACGHIESDEAGAKVREAQFIVSSSFALSEEKRPEQVYVLLWHGFPLKLIGFFDTAASDTSFLDNLAVMSALTDMLTVTSRLSQLTTGGMFSMDPRKVKVTGYPRNDIMLEADARENVRKLLGFDPGASKLVFYLPTMRKGLKAEGAQFTENFFNYEDYDVDALQRFLEEKDAYIVSKLHFADFEMISESGFVLPERMICLGSEAFDDNLLTIYHVMGAFDVLLTDYSSIYADFMLLDKPIIFSCPDIDKYREDRGFVVDDPTLLMPGPICKSQGELIEKLGEAFDGSDAYAEERQRSKPFFNTYSDAESSRRVLDEMEAILQKRLPDSAKSVAPDFCNCHTPLYPYSRRGKARIYVDFGEGFNEADAFDHAFSVGTGCSCRLSFNVDVADCVKGIRFDPDDTGRWFLRNPEITFTPKAGGAPHQLEFVSVNYSACDGTYVPTTKDPQFCVSLVDGMEGTVTISYDCLDLLKDADVAVAALQAKDAPRGKMANALKGIKGSLRARS